MSGFILPQPIGTPIAQWQLVDWQTPARDSDPAAGGKGADDHVATITFPELDTDELWLVDHATVSCTSTTPTRLRWYDSGVGPRYLLDGTGSGNFDVADWPAGLLVRAQSALVVQWTGCSPGAIGSVRLQARQMRRG